MELLQAEAEKYQQDAARVHDIREVRWAQGSYQAVATLMKKLQAEANTAP